MYCYFYYFFYYHKFLIYKLRLQISCIVPLTKNLLMQNTYRKNKLHKFGLRFEERKIETLQIENLTKKWRIDIWRAANFCNGVYFSLAIEKCRQICLQISCIVSRTKNTVWCRTHTQEKTKHKFGLRFEERKK